MHREECEAVWITGVGTANPVFSDAAKFWSRTDAGLDLGELIDTDKQRPYCSYSIVPVDFGEFISKKRDLRAMGIGQRYACHAAGLALASAGLIDEAERKAEVDLMIAVSGGEPDEEIDAAVLEAHVGRELDRHSSTLNGLLANSRPNQFLVQLPNLFAANISIVLGLEGSSLTLMGEEGAAVEVIDFGMQRIATGESSIVLIGGVFNADVDMIQKIHSRNGLIRREHPGCVWHATTEGVHLGSAATFLVLESPASATARRRPPIAKIRNLVHLNESYRAGHYQDRLKQLHSRCMQDTDRCSAFLTNVSDKPGKLRQTLEFWNGAVHDGGGPHVRNTATLTGSLKEAGPFTNLAIAALCAEKGRLYKSAGDREIERDYEDEDSPIVSILCHSSSELESDAMLLVDRP